MDTTWDSADGGMTLFDEKLLASQSTRGGDSSDRALLDLGSGRRIFVVAKRIVGFGKDKKAKSEKQAVDITLRLLPCRDRKTDAENWRRTLMISHTHGFFGCSKNQMYVGNTSLNGIYCIGRDLDSEGMSLSIDEYLGTLEEEKPDTRQDPRPRLKLLKKGDWTRLGGVSTLSLGKTGLLHLKTRVFREQGRVAAMRIERLSNWPQHTYVQLLKRASIGNSSESCIRLGDPSITENAAALTFEKGLFHIERLPSGTGVAVNANALAPEQKVALEEGSRITVGKVNLIFKMATDGDFVDI